MTSYSSVGVHISYLKGGFYLLTHSLRANLNRTYFTNRQDRYMHIRDQPSLAEYCTKFLNLFSKFSYRLESKGPSSPPPGDLPLIWENHVHRIQMKSEVRKALSDLHKSFQQLSKLDSEDTIIFPYAQSGSLGISQEEGLLAKLFSSLDHEEEQSFLDITTGYFAFYSPYQRQLINSSSDCRILVASPLVGPLTR
jgi:CDP-diacylglycerol--glycerol-3-phosphate 3-phosphatidyltransferase